MNNDIHDHYIRNSNKFHQMSQKSTTINKSIYQSGVKVTPNDCIESKTINVFKTKLINHIRKYYSYVSALNTRDCLRYKFVNYISLYAKSNELIQYNTKKILTIYDQSAKY